ITNKDKFFHSNSDLDLIGDAEESHSFVSFEAKVGLFKFRKRARRCRRPASSGSARLRLRRWWWQHRVRRHRGRRKSRCVGPVHPGQQPAGQPRPLLSGWCSAYPNRSFCPAF
ncbi:hypothetical protein CDA63_19865, partial [Hymenobacter amundsenii]